LGEPWHLSDRSGASDAVARAVAASRTCANLKEVYLRERFVNAQAEAEAKDHLVAGGTRLPLAHVPLAVKACFDVAGWVTDAASTAFAGNESAQADGPLVRFFRLQGATIVGHSNMTEFAFGALGVNSTTGTPRTPLDPAGERVAGGSTSGGAVAVAIGLADVALGTDTSGSVRIPAAFCGVVGFRPSRGVFSSGGCIRLTELANRVDVPSISLRDRGQGREPIGLMLTGRRGMDRRLLEIAAHVEAALV
jgi:aspartyl-tRNA(Asn)/glutamyl-tRNA(Gln) amidotransferase subunit A